MSDPFEQLTRSHRRLEERLRDLEEAAQGDRLDDAVERARDVIAFFGHQLRRHEIDEEESLFPRLANVADVAPMVAQLRAEHASHVALHERLERAIENSPVPEEIRRVASALADAYRTHIDVEEAVLFPAAKRALSAEDLAAISGEMQARRGPGGRRGDRR